MKLTLAEAEWELKRCETRMARLAQDVLDEAAFTATISEDLLNELKEADQAWKDATQAYLAAVNAGEDPFHGT